MARTRSLSFIGLPLAALALGASTCGGSSGGTLPFDNLPAELREAACDYYVACQSMPDRATCLASLQLNGAEIATLGADIQAGTVTYDGRAARACVDAFRSLASCKRTLIGDIDEQLGAICDRVFRGMLPPNSACFFSEECADDGICSQTNCTTTDCCAGTCMARPAPIPAGGDCSTLDPNQSCAPGTVCANDPATLTIVCKVPLPVGAQCTPGDRCAAPYSCSNVDPGTNIGVCTPPPGTGQPCGVGDISSSCDDARDSCDLNTHLCTANIPIGGACTPSTAPYCVGYAMCDGTTCVALAGPGASCQTGLNDTCLASLTCDTTMRCALPATGGSCR